MQFRLPEETDETILIEYMQEHYDNGEYGISASMGLPTMPYSEWLLQIRMGASEGDETWGRNLTLLCFDEAQLIGLLSIRYELSEELSLKYGDIGYGVRPSERNKGYATKMLRHAVSVCKDKGMKQVRLGCYKDNAASAKVVEKCGGVLVSEEEAFEPGRICQYFMIEV